MTMKALALLIALGMGIGLGREFGRQDAHAYTATILQACQRAQYDAAVFAQLVKELDVPPPEAGKVLADLRQDRPPLDDAATAPLRVMPLFSATTAQPHLHLFQQRTGTFEVLLGQWTMQDALQHVMHVLEGLEVVPLDQAYRTYLIDTVGLEPHVAGAMVEELAKHRGGA